MDPTVAQAVYDQAVADLLNTISVQLDTANYLADASNTELQMVNDLHGEVTHLSGQIDILNHSIYVGNELFSFTAVCIALIAALLMFAVGFMLVKGR